MLLSELSDPEPSISSLSKDHINLLIGDVEFQMSNGKTIKDAVNFVINTDPDFEYSDKSKLITDLIRLYKDRK